MKRLNLYWNTLRYLKPVQVFGRIRFQLAQPKADNSPAPALRQARRPVRVPWRQASITGPCQLQFLGETGGIGNASDWRDPARSALWLYNAHYFDDLTAIDASGRHGWQTELINRWILENPPVGGVGWAPYPTSLRLVNWTFWLLDNPDEQTLARLQSMAVQTRYLAQRLEHHILGNHLLANAKALVFSGLMFAGAEAEGWYQRGMALLIREFGEQVLPDGGHFERSPMYHNIILTDLLDLLALHAAFDRPAPARWPGLVQNMLEWAAAMTHPDGEIALFNDAAFDIAPNLWQLHDYAAKVGVPVSPSPLADITILQPSGYVRLVAGDASVIADLAPVGPDHLPAHGHADTLSFELSLGQDRVVVNGGTSLYGLGPERHRQRGTANHSTLVVDGANSSEVWADFRVARRARVTGVEASRTGQSLWAKGTHDGYVRLPGKVLHSREWTLTDGRLIVTDRLTGAGKHHVAILFHLAPGLLAAKESDGTVTLHAGQNRRLQVVADGAEKLSIAASTWHPRFGQTVANQCIRIELLAGLPLTHNTTFTWMPA